MWEWEGPADDEGGGGDDGGGGSGGLTAAEIADFQKAELERRKEQERIEQRINAVMDDRIAAYKNTIKMQKLEVDAISKMTDKQKQLNQEKINAEKALAKVQQEKGDDSREAIIAGKRLIAAKGAAEEHGKALTDMMKKLVEMGNLPPRIAKQLQEMSDTDILDNEKLDSASAGLGKMKGDLDHVENAADDVNNAFNFMSKKLGITAKASDTTLGKMVQGASNVAMAFRNDAWGATKLLAGGVMSLFSPMNILGNVATIMVEQFFAIEEATIALTKATGAARDEMQGILVAAQSEQLGKYNISVKDMGKAYTAARLELAGFAEQDESVRDSITKTNTLVAKLGISEKKTAKLTRMMSYEFGGVKKGAEAGNKAMVQFIATARNMGLDAQQAASDFESFAGTVMSMGGDAKTEILNLGKASQKTGVSITQMLNVAKAFNKFSSGADKAAQMNAVFGTSISAISMQSMTASEINEEMRMSLINATGGYEAMTKHQRLAAAEILGFGDNVQLLQGYLEHGVEVDEEAIAKQKAHAESLAELQGNVMDMVPALTQLMNKFKEAMMKGGGFEKVLEALIAATPTLLNLAEKLASIFGWMGNNIGKVTFAYVGLKLAQLAYTVHQASYMAALASGMTLEQAATASKFAFGSASWFAVSAGIVLAAVLIGLMAAFLLSGSPALWEMGAIMAIGIIALGAAFYFAGPAMMAALPALIVIMAGLVGIFYVLPPLIDAISGLLETVISAVGPMFAMAGALVAIGAGFFFLGKMALMATLGIAAGTIALFALRASMALSGTSFADLISIGQAVGAMGEGIKNLRAGLSGLGTAASGIRSAMGDGSLMIQSDGTMTTVVAGQGGMFMMMPNNITVDVNMDEAKISAPEVNVTVVLDGEELRHLISEMIVENR